MHDREKIAVVGSSNVDLTVYTPRLPREGETLRGNDFKIGFGGKGANQLYYLMLQAVAAAKLGAEVVMVSTVGYDSFGRDTIKNYSNHGIDTSHVYTVPNVPTGVAPIMVDSEGRNSIIIVPGANDRLSTADVEKARAAIAGCRILVTQLEVPVETTLAALKLGRQLGLTTIFNPAPGLAELPAEIFTVSDFVCPNETEAEILTGQKVGSIPEAEEAAKALISKGAKNVVITLGEKGAVWLAGGLDKAVHIPGRVVKAVDTSGAGDAFIGALAYFLALGSDVSLCLEKANFVASESVQKHGTQTSFPKRSDLPPSFFDLTK